MKDKKIEMSLFKRLVITFALLSIGFKNILFGCMLLPMLAEKIGEHSIGTMFFSIGILAEGVVIAYCVLKLNGVMN